MRISSRTVVTIVALGCLTSTAACAGRREPSAAGLYSNEDRPVVTVTNHHWFDVAVYVLRGAARFRVATISGSGSGTFALTGEDGSGARPVRLMADPIGSNRPYVTEPIVVGRGQAIELRVGNPITVSTYSIRNR